MAVITLEGLMEIDMADVFGWLSTDHAIKEDVRNVRFSIEDDALVLEMSASNSLRYIDSVDLWNWVIKNHLPAGINHYESVFGVPSIDKDKAVLAITFAAATDGNPRSWATPPACLAEWKRDASVSA